MTATTDPHLLQALAPDRGQVPSLDGLRAISISLVLLMHFLADVPGAPPVPGLFGVEIFFVISGFLITRLLLAEILETGGLSLANFYFRRLLRLMPPLLALVIAITIFMAWHGARDLRAGLCAITYVTNYCVTEIGTMYDGPGNVLEGTWSLAVEEHFYLVFPLILLAGFRRSFGALYAIVGVICVCALAARLGYTFAGKPQIYLVWRTESTVDMLMAGCVLSIMSAHDAGRHALRKVATNAFLAVASGAFMLAELVSTSSQFAFAISQSVVAFWIAVMIANLLLNPELGAMRGLLNRPGPCWLGRISYSLYLWHGFVALIDQRYGLLHGYAGAAAGILASVAVAALSYYLLERPILVRRSRWAKRLNLGAPAPVSSGA